MSRKKRAVRGYVDLTMLDGELLYARGKVHWAILVEPVIGAVFAMVLSLIFLSMFGLSGQSRLWFLVPLVFNLPWIQAVIYTKTTESAVTSSRVILKTGWLSRKTDEISLRKVESVLMSQGIIGRIFNFGSVLVIGTGGNKVLIRGIADPMSFRAVVQAVAMNG